MTGLFSELSANSGGADGAFYGRPIQLWYQIAGILTAIGMDFYLVNQFSFLFRFYRFCWWLHNFNSSYLEIYNWNSFIT